MSAFLGEELIRANLPARRRRLYSLRSRVATPPSGSVIRSLALPLYLFPGRRPAEDGLRNGRPSVSSPRFTAYRTNDEWFAVNLADAVAPFMAS
jgi:hypothetical protein